MATRTGGRAARSAGVIILVLLSATAAGLLPTGCSRDGAEAEPSVAPPPHRVVVLAPAAAEMLEALGQLDLVVGVGEFGPWPAPIAGLPRVGGYDAPNVERLIELDCDLLLTARSDAALDAHGRLKSLGIRVAELDTSTYEGVFESLFRLGGIFGREAAARGIQERIRGELDATATRTASLRRPRVLVVVGRDPLYVAGPGSHVDEMIRLAGGTNVAGDARSPYQQVSLEVILERMPEVIVDAADNRPGALRGRHPGVWGRWEFLPAVERDRIYHVDPGLLLIPGLRLPQMTLLMGRMIHPEEFGEPADDSLAAARED